MNCYKHLDVSAAGMCIECGKPFCTECITEVNGKYHCKDCIEEKISSQEKKIERLENKNQTPLVFMNAGGGSSSSAAVATTSKRYNRSRITAIILALALGIFGAHHFYLGNTMWGIVYLIFCWTCIPLIAGWIEAILYFMMSDEAFDRRYNM